jgi:sulfate permease, SulP family
MSGPAEQAGAQALSGWALLRRYRRPWLRPDLVAGLTVGAMLVPQSMAYAELAGAPAATGLYAALLAPVAYALVGSSRHLGTGPEPGTAILAAAAVATVAGGSADPARLLALTAALALLVAAVCGIAWLLRLGFIAEILSRPVLVGYISGVGIVLISSQLSALTGVPITARELGPRVAELVAGIDQVRWTTLLIGTLSFAALLALRRWLPTVPGALVVVGGATAVVWTLGLAGEPTIGAIPEGLPALGVPTVDLADLRALLPGALGIALVGYSDNVLTARAVAGRLGYRIDPGRELAGLAVANLAAGIAQGMPVSSSASRSAVPATLGSVTSLVSIIASGFVLVTLIAARGVLAAVPRAALAAVILSAAVAIIDVAGFRDLWRISRAELGLAVATSLGVIIFDVLVGVSVAVVLSAVVALWRMARPHDSVLGSRADLDGWVAVDEDPGARTRPVLLVYRFDAPLFFANADRFRTRLLAALEANPGPERWVVLDFEGIGDVDTTAVDALRELLPALREAGVEVVAAARANEQARRRLQRAGLLTGAASLVTFPTINAAVRAHREWTHARPPADDSTR